MDELLIGLREHPSLKSAEDLIAAGGETAALVRYVLGKLRREQPGWSRELSEPFIVAIPAAIEIVDAGDDFEATYHPAMTHSEMNPVYQWPDSGGGGGGPGDPYISVEDSPARVEVVRVPRKVMFLEMSKALRSRISSVEKGITPLESTKRRYFAASFVIVFLALAFASLPTLLDLLSGDHNSRWPIQCLVGALLLLGSYWFFLMKTWRLIDRLRTAERNLATLQGMERLVLDFGSPAFKVYETYQKFWFPSLTLQEE